MAPITEITLPIGLPGACHQRPLPRAASTNDTNETVPNTNNTAEPNDMAEYGLKIGVGKRSLSKSMCQKRSGWPRSTVRNNAHRMISGNAIRWPSRIAARSDRSPNRSSQAAAKYTPPVTPPVKKYSTIHQPQLGVWNDGLKSGGIWPSLGGPMPSGRCGRNRRAGRGGLAWVHTSLAERQHARHARHNRRHQPETTADGQVVAWQVWCLGQSEGG